ncbi:MAG TPA: phosphoribosylglycinamide formyltransferase [Thermoanaerobaculia bacterium]|nr:phosphoribosylglycinamide formyltransferase [Thermoanaerobaculia bacterium]
MGVLLSGRGSNFLALHAAAERGELPARIVVVVSDVPEAPGIVRARELGMPTAPLPRRDFADRAAHEEAILAVLAAHGVEWVCLAGFMRLLSPAFLRAFPQRVLNIHPSLLPAFPGLHPQRQALEHGVKLSGCTVHFVDEGVDSGPIVVQRVVPVLDGDDEAALAARILAEEHRAYPEALRRLIGEPWRVDGRRVRFGTVGSGAAADDLAAAGEPAQAARG